MRRPNVALTLGQRRERGTSIKAALGQCFVLAPTVYTALSEGTKATMFFSLF